MSASEDTDEEERGGQAEPGQPPVNVSNWKNATDWLLGEIGDPVTPLAGLFNYGGQLIHIHALDGDGYRCYPDDGGPVIEPVDHYKLAGLVTTRYATYKMIRNPVTHGTFPAPTLYPRDAARAVRNCIRDAIELRHLRAVIHTPLPRADGTLITQPGYDDDSELAYLPDPDVDVGDIPHNPTHEQLTEATALLEHMVCDFPWAGEHDKANYLGLLLTPLLRELVPGPYKLGAIGARQPGSGKSLLGKLLRGVHGGDMCSLPGSEDELGKVILSKLARTTEPTIEFDNCTGTIKSGKLAALLTSGTVSGRPLGVTGNISVRNDRLWLINGNNISLGGDLIRRTVWVTIDPHMENPEKRNDFEIPFLEAWVADHRSDILRALLIWIAAWRAAGKPAVRTDSDVYGPWIATVRGILQFAAVSGVFAHEDSAEQELGEEDDEWREFLRGVHDRLGSQAWTAKELLAMMGDTDTSPMKRLSEDILPSEVVLRHRHWEPLTGLAKSFGRWLANRKGRWAGGYMCHEAGKNRNGIIQWRVQRVDGQTTRGDTEPDTHDAESTIGRAGLLPSQGALFNDDGGA